MTNMSKYNFIVVSLNKTSNWRNRVKSKFKFVTIRMLTAYLLFVFLLMSVKSMEQRPTELKINTLDVNNRTSLKIECKESNKTDTWSSITEIELSTNQDYKEIIRLEIKYCPLIQEGWNVLFKEVNLTAPQMESIEFLDLRNNNLTLIPHVNGLKRLANIDLSRNDLSEIGSGTFAELPDLKKLILHSNKITKLGVIQATALTDLDVSFNNQLKELQNDSFRFLKNLRRLNIHHCNIQTIHYKTFEPLVSLEDLDLSHNQITFSQSSDSGVHFFGDFFVGQSPFRSNFGFKKLILSHNRIDKLGYSDWAQVLTQIQEIDLEHNQIHKISANELDFMSNNLTLNLEHNEIKQVDMRLAGWLLDEPSSNKKSINVFLAGNPLQCDCLGYGLKNFKSASIDLKIKDLYCSTPPKLQGIKL